ncbi:MAG: Hsp20/alpha crystallin family protein [Rhodothermaceae bacterium]|nr:Hsp20/alpha crystallin family protein [Rhodothermaceae bacterium]
MTLVRFRDHDVESPVLPRSFSEMLDTLKIELEDNTLTVSGERKFEKEEKNKRYHLVESRFGTFKRSFTLPRHIDNTSIDAKMNEGILNITIKKDEKSVSRQIAIK